MRIVIVRYSCCSKAANINEVVLHSVQNSDWIWFLIYKHVIFLLFEKFYTFVCAIDPLEMIYLLFVV